MTFGIAGHRFELGIRYPVNLIDIGAISNCALLIELKVLSGDSLQKGCQANHEKIAQP